MEGVIARKKRGRALPKICVLGALSVFSIFLYWGNFTRSYEELIELFYDQEEEFLRASKIFSEAAENCKLDIGLDECQKLGWAARIEEEARINGLPTPVIYDNVVHIKYFGKGSDPWTNGYIAAFDERGETISPCRRRGPNFTEIGNSEVLYGPIMQTGSAAGEPSYESRYLGHGWYVYKEYFDGSDGYSTEPRTC